VDDAILDRIKRCVERENYPNISETEARVALLLSTRLMQQHDVGHADLARDEADDAVQYDGSSTISIHGTVYLKPMVLEYRNPCVAVPGTTAL